MKNANNQSLQDDLVGLSHRLSCFDPMDLLATVGALQLMPENGDRFLRLEVLAHVAALPEATSPNLISRGRLKQVCNSAPIGAGVVASWEDPNPEMLTDSVPFFGGAYTVFPGTASHSAYLLRMLIHALFHFGTELNGAEFLRRCRSVILSALLVGDEIARRAGLPRGFEPHSSPKGDLVVPPAPELARLKTAVAFSADNIKALLNEHSIATEDWERLVSPAGGVNLAKYALDQGELCGRPLVRCQGMTTVVLPGMLPSAARNAALVLTQEYGVQETVVRLFNRAVWNNVVMALDFLGCRQTDAENDAAAVADSIRDGFFSLDTDKCLYVLLLTDSLDGYQASEMFGHWEVGRLKNVLKERIASAVQGYRERMPGQKRLFILLVTQSFGRSLSFAADELFDNQDFDFLHLSASELEILSLIEGGNALALWKFARSAERARQTATIQSFSVLDEFHFYRHHKYSHYHADDRAPDLLMLGADMGSGLRKEMHRRRDWHAVLSADRRSYIEVMSYQGDRRVPIYMPVGGLSDQVALLVEDLPLPVWVASPAFSNGRLRELRQNYLQFIDSITYWLWQFTPALRQPLECLRSTYPNLRIEIDLPEGEDWQNTQSGEDTGLALVDSIEVFSDPRRGVMRLTIHNSILPLCTSATNGAERLLMGHVLASLQRLLPDDSILSDNHIVDIIERYAPHSGRKMLLMLNLDHAFELDNRGLPAYRKVQDADQEELLDDLGDHLRLVERVPTGRIADGQRTAFINGKVVSFFFNELTRIVGSLAPEGLLGELILRHESILQHGRQAKLTIPTRLACFDFDPDLQKTIHGELHDNSTAALTHRFLIEYVAACPPDGTEDLSLATYDRLLALAWHIIQFGFTSDIIQYGLADIPLAMLPSGRLGQDMQAFDQARRAFMPLFAAGQVDGAKKDFARFWREHESDSQPTSLDRDEEAMRAELGFTMTEISSFCGVLIPKAFGSDGGCGYAPLDALVEEVGGALAWPEQRTTGMFDLLLSRPRADFLKPPKPYRNFDVWPWRFNRRLSYLRRPLLLRHDGGTDYVLWGPRHLFNAVEYLANLLFSGRLPAHGEKQSAVMNVHQGKLNATRGPEFERTVEAHLNSVGHLTVKRSVKEIDSLRLGNIGDIDILIADPKRRTLYVLECKDLSLAKTPYEMGQQLTALYDADLAQKSAVAQALRKSEWVRANLAPALKWLGIPPSSKVWRVTPAVVIDQRMLTPYLTKAPIAIIPLQDLIAIVTGKSVIS